MSTTIDQRVVEMRFDNKQFESNVQASLTTLDKLKSSLNMNGATKGFEQIDNAAKKVNMSGLGNAVESVRLKFSALEVMAVTALSNITNSIVNTGKQMIASFTIDPIKTGFAEYETQIGAVQTILANTSHQGTNLQQVNRALDELNTYADKTIYNFTEMTRNIGTFTAAGLDLKTSVKGIQGIANLAAVSGSTSQQASTAMYQLSQALSAGTIRLMDWNSVVNAGMGGKVFQDAIIKTGKEMGVLNDRIISAYENGESFRNLLNPKDFGDWFTSDLLSTTLSKFTKTGVVEYMVELSGISRENVQSLQDLGDEVGYDSEAFNKLAASLTNGNAEMIANLKSTLSMAATAEDAATKVKTLTQLFDTMKESVQSGWTQTWEILVGDFEEAKEVLTEVSKVVGDVISKSAEARNKVLSGGLSSGWKQLLGAGIADETGYIESIQEIARANGDAFDKMVADSDNFSDALKKGLEEGVISSETLSDAVFNLQSKMSGMTEEEKKAAGCTSEMVAQIGDLASGLKDGSVSMDEFAEKMLRPSGRENLIQALWNAAKGLMSVITPIKEAFQEIFPPYTAEQLYALTEGIKTFTEHLKLTGEASDNLKRTFKGLFAVVDIFTTLTGGALKTAIKVICSLLGMADVDVFNLTANIGDMLVKFRNWLLENNRVAKGFRGLGNSIVVAIRKTKDWFQSFKDLPQVQNGIAKFSNFISDCMGDLNDYFSGGIERIKEFIGRLREMDSITLDNLGTIFKDFRDNIIDYFLNIGDSFSNVREAFDQFKNNIKTRLEEAGESLDTFKGKLANFVLEARSKISNNPGMGELLTVGLGTGMIITIKKLGDALETLAGPLGDIADVVKNFNGILVSVKKAINAFALQTKSKALLNVAIAIGVLAASIGLLTLLDQDKLWSAVGALGALAAGLLAVSAAMGAISKIGGGSLKSSASIVSIAGSLLILVGVLKTMESLDGNKVWSNIAVLGVMVSGLALVAGLLGKFAPKLSKGSFGLMAIATALKIMVSALSDLCNLEIDNLDRSIGMLLGILASLALVSVACKTIKLSSAVGVLALVATLKIFIATFEDFANMDIDNIKINIQSFAGILVMFAGLIAASKFAGANAVKVGVGILAMSAALILVMTSFKMIAGMNKSILSNVTSTVSQILLVFGAVMTLSNFAGANAAKAGVMLLMISGALVVLSGAIVILSHIDPNGLTRAVAAISVLEIMFAGLIAVTALAQECKSTLVLLSVTIGILSVALGTLSMINPENLKTASVSLSAIIAMFAMLVASTSLAKSATKTLVVVTAVVAALGGILYLLAGLPTNSVMPVAEALSLLLTSLSVSLLIIGKMGVVAPTALTTMAVITLIVAGLAAIIGVLASMNLGSTLEIAVSLSTLLLALSAACTILTLVGATGPAAFIGIGALATLIVGIGGLMAGIGALVAYFPDMELFVTKGISLLEQIGYGIGSFFGNIVGSFLGNMTSGLPSMAEDLSLFMTNMQPFFDGVSNINPAAMDGVKALAETILVLTAANILDGITSWLTGGSSLTGFAEDLVPFGKAMKQFSNEIAGIDGETIANAAIAGKTLAEMAATLPNAGGVVGWFTGENDMNTFGEQLIPFGRAMKNFGNEVAGLNAKVITEAATAGKALAEMASTVPNSGGVVGFFAGENDMDAFGEQLVPFGRAMKQYGIAVSGLKADVIQNSVTAGKALMELANTVPNTGGVVAWFTGDNDLTTFGEQLVPFGRAMKNYSLAVTGLDTQVVTNSANAAKALVELSNNLPNTGGVVSWFTGDNDITSFGKQLVSFGQSFANYYNSISGVDTGKLNSVAAEFRNLVDLATGIKNVDTSGMSNFASNLTKLGNSGINGFINAFTNANSRVTSAATTMVNNFASAANSQSGNLNTTFTTIVSGCLTAIKNKALEFNTVSQALMMNFIYGVKSKDLLTKNAFTTIVSGCLTAIKNKVSEFKFVGELCITKFIAGMKSKDSSNKETFTNSLSDTISSVKDYYDDFYDAGEYLVKGFANGIDKNIWLVEDKAAAMAKAAADAAEDELDINSPSKVGYKIGGFFGIGFINSLIDYAAKSYEAGSNIAASAKKGLAHAVAKIGEFIDNDIDTEPTIRPLLDLSDVQSKARQLTAILSRTQAAKIATSMNGKATRTIQNEDSATPIAGNTYSFTQNNYSPKALSRVELYRQTKNQFSAMERMVKA